MWKDIVPRIFCVFEFSHLHFWDPRLSDCETENIPVFPWRPGNFLHPDGLLQDRLGREGPPPILCFICIGRLQIFTFIQCRMIFAQPLFNLKVSYHLLV